MFESKFLNNDTFQEQAEDELLQISSHTPIHQFQPFPEVVNPIEETPRKSLM